MSGNEPDRQGSNDILQVADAAGEPVDAGDHPAAEASAGGVSDWQGDEPNSRESRKPLAC
jgi:hypothetical protein